MKILRCSFLLVSSFSINICFFVVFATATSFVGVICWYANIFSVRLQKLLFFLHGNILSEIRTNDYCFQRIGDWQPLDFAKD